MFGFKRGGIGLVSAAGVVAILGGWLASVAPAVGEQIGSAVVNGRTVILDDDGTWKYKSASNNAANSKCDTVGTIQLCIRGMGWRETPKQGDFSVLYTYKNKYYFGVISEPYGTKDGVTAEALRTAIIENVATVAKIKPKDIPVIDSSDSVEGHPELKSITYTASLPNMRSMKFVYHNVIHLSDHESVQILFWGVGKTLSSEFKSVITKTLDNITFN